MFKKEVDLPNSDKTPNTVLENQAYSWSRPKISGDKAPPTRAQLEQKPTAEDRIQVGYNSAENVYRMEKQAATANFPTKAMIFEISSITWLHSRTTSVISQLIKELHIYDFYEAK